jgi:hypothetical protein
VGERKSLGQRREKTLDKDTPETENPSLKRGAGSRKEEETPNITRFERILPGVIFCLLWFLKRPNEAREISTHPDT